MGVATCMIDCMWVNTRIKIRRVALTYASKAFRYIFVVLVLYNQTTVSRGITELRITESV